jgi:hypothetical protein
MIIIGMKEEHNPKPLGMSPLKLPRLCEKGRDNRANDDCQLTLVYSRMSVIVSRRDSPQVAIVLQYSFWRPSRDVSFNSST